MLPRASPLGVNIRDVPPAQRRMGMHDAQCRMHDARLRENFTQRRKGRREKVGSQERRDEGL